jgi:universal stress protein E
MVRPAANLEHVSHPSDIGGAEQDMDRPRHILVVIDPTATHHPALERARALALAFGARVELFVCHVKHATDELRVDEIELERLAGLLHEHGIETSTDAAADVAIYSGVLAKVQRSRPCLVIKDTHPHSLLRRTVLANTDWQLIRLCPVPLLFVRPGAWHEPPRIAAAIDIALPGEKPAALDHLLLATGESFALATRGELCAVHAYQPMSDVAATATALAVPMAAGVDSDSIVADGVALASGQLDEIAASHNVRPENRRLLIGRPSEALVDYVRQSSIDVLVMGAYARGLIYNVLVGSTTERILDLLPCDVLVLKPASFEYPLNWEARKPRAPRGAFR